MKRGRHHITQCMDCERPSSSANAVRCYPCAHKRKMQQNREAYRQTRARVCAMRKWEREVLKIARELGATDVRIVPGGKHSKLVGKWRGIEFWRAIPGTPGDKRTLVHTRTGLERAMRRAAGETVATK